MNKLKKTPPSSTRFFKHSIAPNAVSFMPHLISTILLIQTIDSGLPLRHTHNGIIIWVALKYVLSTAKVEASRNEAISLPDVGESPISIQIASTHLAGLESDGEAEVTFLEQLGSTSLTSILEHFRNVICNE